VTVATRPAGDVGTRRAAVAGMHTPLKRRSFPLATALPAAVAATLAAGLVAGCGPDYDDDLTTEEEELLDGQTDVPSMGALPPEAREQIAADLDGARITSIEPIAVPAGGPVHKVTYVENGDAKQRYYTREGLRLAVNDPRSEDLPPLDQEITEDGDASASPGPVGGLNPTVTLDTGMDLNDDDDELDDADPAAYDDDDGGLFNPD